ncbi:hypothetical protein Pint_05227 [Pistacia integerrima]|uniref:Uncharacterized protein n=1 Tax=Pistacia integerrima TaxID=434235 RepID=A0ACC0Z3X2_9ROSI|nr:hypothetical protein Pint_05227 [Pistacia integerrima]
MSRAPVALLGPPIPSQELGHGLLAKAIGLWSLEWRAQREAGFTEQRKPPARGSGRITERCLMSPAWLTGLAQSNHHFFLFFQKDLSFFFNFVSYGDIFVYTNINISSSIVKTLFMKYLK